MQGYTNSGQLISYDGI